MLAAPERDPWLSLLLEIQAIGQAGLWYAKDDFDRERYERLRELALEGMEMILESPPEKLRISFLEEKGYQTPKLDTRVAAFSEDGKLCFIRERNGLWALPGGWVDHDQTIYSNCHKEAKEEAGLTISDLRPIAFLEHNLHNEPTFPWGIVKCFVEARAGEVSFEDNIETSEVAFFARDEIPELFSAKNTVEQIEMCFAAHDAGQAWKVICD